MSHAMTTTELPRLVKFDKDDVLIKARHLMDKHGIPDWKICVTRKSREIGLCTFSTKTIDISVYQREGDLEDTILHEIAHALVGPSGAHGPVWRAKAIELGARPDERCRAVLGPGVGWRYTCSDCGGLCAETVGKLKNIDKRLTRCCYAAIVVTKG